MRRAIAAPLRGGIGMRIAASAVVFAAIAFIHATAPSRADAEVPAAASDQYRTKMQKWVETRQILSEERSDWLVERESLEATRDLLRDERKALKEQIESLKQTEGGAESERLELAARRDAYRQSAEVLEGKVLELEQQVLALVPKLPEPLQKKLEPILVQIPTNPELAKAGLGQRLVNVLAVVAQAEKWNGTATFVGETRDVGNGQKVAVRTLYWGLAQAVYVDSQGETAGIGRPTAEGWKFVDDPDLADSAKEILDIYEGIVDTIAFVPVPAEIE
ncbi:MAG: DUF3450 family protein [Myxococcota bacterium]